MPRFGIMATLDDWMSMQGLNPDFLELLIRHGDSKERIRRFVDDCECELVFHAQELISSEVLMDISNPRPKIREMSLARIFEIVDAIGDRPLVIHPGGVGPDPQNRDDLFPHLIESLNSLSGELWIENMPPRYAHGGDRWYCSLLTDSSDVERISHLVRGFTLDISHAFLWSGMRGVERMVRGMGARTRHVHLSDARMPFGEGLQLGEGDVDFSFLDELDHLPLLLEIWNGHLEGGRGFRIALERARAWSLRGQD